MRFEAKSTKATASYYPHSRTSKETTALILTPIRVRANTKNAPDEAANFPERKVCVNRDTADN